MPTEVVSTLDSGGGGDYTTIAAWLTATSGDLVTADEVQVLEVPSGNHAEPSFIVPTGSTTDATRYRVIRAASGAEFNGTPGAGAKITFAEGGTSGCIRPAEDYFRMESLEVVNTGASPLFSNAGDFLTRINCLFSNTAYTGSDALAGDSGTALLRNCLVISGGRAMDIRADGSTVENCTFIGVGTNTYGLLTDSGSTVKNTVVTGFATEDIFGTPGTNTTNATGDGSVGTNIADTDFNDFAGGDYSPAASGLLDGTGTNLSSDFTDDITGTTRGQWDIGAFALAGGGTAPISFSGTVPDQEFTKDAAITDVDLSSYFSGTETPFTFAVQSGVLPTGLSLSSAGVLSGTPTAAGSATIVVRGTDDGSDTADTNSFDITVSEPDGTLTFTSSHALKNNTGTVLASETGIRLHILNAATLASVLELTEQATNASGILSAVTNAALTPSTSYIVAVRLSDGSAGLSDPITAT